MELNSEVSRHSILTAGAIALICFLSARIADDLLDFGTAASPVWPPAGVALAALLLFGRRQWVGVALGMLLFDLSLQVSWASAGVMATGQTLGAIAADELLRRIKFRLSFIRLRDVLGFIFFGVFLSPVVNATISTLNARLTGIISWQNFGLHWGIIWLGDGIGILVITPLFLTWLGKSYPEGWSWRSLSTQWQQNLRFRQRAIESLIWLITLLAVSWAVFQSPSDTRIARYPLEYLPFPFIIWAALRLGQRGTVLGSSIISSDAILGTVRGNGPFITETDGNVWEAIFLLQAFVGIITATALVLATVVTERQQVEEQLRANEEQLRGMFEGAAIGIGLDDLDGRVVKSNPALQRMLGYNQEELSRMNFADFTYPEDLAADVELFQEMIAGQRNAYQLEKRHIRKDGETIWVRLTNSLVRDETGNPRFTIGMVEDISELKRAEESIRLYANIVQNMQIGLIVWHLQDLHDVHSFRLVDINPAARQILQITACPRDLIGQRMEEVFPSLMESAFPGIYASVIRSGKERDLGEIRYGDEVMPEGIYATKAFPLPNQCLGLMFEDITNRKQAEEALQQSEARFRVIAETAACAVLVYQGTRLRYVNPATERITGYSRDEILSIDFWNLAHPEFRELVQQRGLARQRGEAVPSRYEIKILTKSGQERWVDFTAGVIVYEGKPAGIATAYDITDRKQAEEKLLWAANRERLLAEMASRIRSSLKLEEILQTTVDEVRGFLKADRVFISYFDEAGGCQAVSESVDPQWGSILGWEVTDEKVLEFKTRIQSSRIRVVNDTSVIEEPPFLRECYEQGKVRALVSVSLMLKDRMFGVLIANQCSGPREWQPFEIELLEQLATGVEIAIQQGQYYRQVQILAASLERQVEERTAELQQRMQELQNLNQVKDLLLHAVSHDLRTPVQGMLMVLNRLRSKCCDCETVSISRFVLDCMIQSSEDQLRLLNVLRDDQSTDEPKLHLERQPICFSQLLRAALTTVEPLLNQSKAVLTNQITDDLPTIFADPNQLRQVLESLLSNAVKHNLPGVAIALHAEVIDPDSPPPISLPASDSNSKILYITVEDAGVGMNREQCDRLFKPYVRSLDNPNRTGIGSSLYRCRQIITAHGGQIGVISQPGKGSKFWFTLPLV